MSSTNEKGMPIQNQPGMEGNVNVGYASSPGVPPPVAGQQIQMMIRPAAIPGVPSGLEYLTQIDQLLIHQQIEILEMVTGWETKNRYQIKNSLGQQVYFATEESGCCMRQCCANARGFIMHITDNLGQEVIRVNREFKCCAGCCWCASNSCGCCQMIVTVEAPVGTVIGSCVQQCSKWKPNYDIYDGDGQKIFAVQGPCCPCQAICCTGDNIFQLLGTNDVEIGKVSKQWGGCLRETFTKASNFSVTFPVDLDVRMKAVILGSVFLIDFMYFEYNGNNNN